MTILGPYFQHEFYVMNIYIGKIVVVVSQYFEMTFNIRETCGLKSFYLKEKILGANIMFFKDFKFRFGCQYKTDMNKTFIFGCQYTTDMNKCTLLPERTSRC